MGLFPLSSPGRAGEAPVQYPYLSYSLESGDFQDGTNGFHIPAGMKKIQLKLDNSSRDPKAMRFQTQWMGVDTKWMLRVGEMGLVVRFHDRAGNLTGQKEFYTNRESPGWDGGFEHSPLLGRREIITIPKEAERLSFSITSAGPPDAIGTYVVGTIEVYHRAPSGDLKRISDFDFATLAKGDASGEPAGWVRDGTNRSMARAIRLADGGKETTALGIVDNDPMAHAEWRLKPGAYIPVVPGEELMIEWEEMFSIGLSGCMFTNYTCPPPGNYQFRIGVFDAMGRLQGEKFVPVTVSRPYWMQWWFWGVLAVPLVFGIRAIVRARVRSQLSRMEQEHAVERERLRIARNIHDDLGARLTHIWLVSGRAEVEDLSPEELRQGFQKISGLTSDLVNSLYETVWSVNPENDHLDSLLNHLTQMTRNMCDPVSIPCRVHVPEVVPHHPVPSGTRHAISLTVKEALHNAIKHSGASEVSATFVLKVPFLRIEISDNGRGFTVGKPEHGHGLRNMQDRMNELGGTARFESVPNERTVVILEAPILRTSP